MSSKITPKPQSGSDATGFGCARGSSSVFVVGALVVTAVVAGVIVASALTSWWVLFGLFAVCPVMMLFCGAAMMAARRSSSGGGFWPAAPCASWWKGDVAAGTD